MNKAKSDPLKKTFTSFNKEQKERNQSLQYYHLYELIRILRSLFVKKCHLKKIEIF